MTPLAHIIATFAYIGHLRPAPGTWGSLVALPAAYGIYEIAGVWGILIATVLAYGIGLWATKLYTDQTGNHDPSEVVIDEVVGQWIALAPVIFGAAYVEADVFDLWPGWITAFVFFRVFDIWKPSFVGRTDRRGDATGVMLDDVYAGVFAAIAVAMIGVIWHAWLLL